MPDIANVAPCLQSALEGYPFFMAVEGEETEEDRAFRLVREERARGVLKDDLTRQIDHILYTEWDPIGVHSIDGFDCYDEYHRYLPVIVEMLREDASLEAISDQLMEFESFIFSETDCLRRRCDVIAVMVSQYGPHAAKNRFMVTLRTDTPEAAHQTVLDLVTQARLDAYEDKWEVVCRSYEQAVEICQTFLPRRNVLVGMCLHNLGHAHTMTQQPDQARAALEEAVRKLKPIQCSGSIPDWKIRNLECYTLCLRNLVALSTRQGDRAASVRYARALVSYQARSNGSRSDATQSYKELLRKIIMRERVTGSLRCSRMSFEQDSCGVIGQVIVID